MKRCNACRNLLTSDSFYSRKGKPDGLATTCRECTKEKVRLWYANNKDRHKLSCGRYARNNRERVREIKRRSAKKRAAVIAAYFKSDRGRDVKKRAGAKWAANNLEYGAAKTRNYRARKAAAPGTHTAEDVAELLRRQRGKCAICRRGCENDYHVDHIQPLYRGGPNNRRNLQILCAKCNTSKGARDPLDHMRRLGMLL